MVSHRFDLWLRHKSGAGLFSHTHVTVDYIRNKVSETVNIGFNLLQKQPYINKF